MSDENRGDDFFMEGESSTDKLQVDETPLLHSRRILKRHAMVRTMLSGSYGRYSAQCYLIVGDLPTQRLAKSSSYSVPPSTSLLTSSKGTTGPPIGPTRTLVHPLFIKGNHWSTLQGTCEQPKKKRRTMHFLQAKYHRLHGG